MNYAVNRDEINKIAAVGLGQVSCAILPKEHWACDAGDGQNFYTYDPEKAKKLLADAGHANGLEIEKPSAGPIRLRHAAAGSHYLSQLAKVGIHIKLTPLAAAAGGARPI